MRFILLTFICLFTLAAQAADGERWEYQNTMKMEGMSMPAMTAQMCQEPGWKSPPKGDDQSNCKVKDYQKNGNKLSWKMECPEGSGRGEMTLQGNDKFVGFTEFTTADGKMRMDMTGRKIGSCDPGKTRNVVNGQVVPNQAEMDQYKAQAETGQKQAKEHTDKHQKMMGEKCSESLKGMNFQAFYGEPSMCPEQKPKFCQQLKTNDGALRAAAHIDQPLLQLGGIESPYDQMLGSCSMKGEKKSFTTTVCKQATAKSEWTVLGNYCPEQATALAAKHCHKQDDELGDIVAKDPKYQGVCKYHGAADDAAASPAEQMKKMGMDEGMNALKDGLMKW